MLEEKYVIVGGKKFKREIYEYLLTRFKEGFSHTSLTIEDAFKELDDLDLVIENSKDEDAAQCYHNLPFSQKHEIYNVLRQIVVFQGKRMGVFPFELDGTQKQFNKLYAENFSYFDEYLPYFVKFYENNQFDRVATLHRLSFLFLHLPQREVAYQRAYNMQKDHLDAFDYAMALDELTIHDIIDINNIVNRSDPDRVEGFKKTNNDIFSASFTPTDKKYVPTEMQRLLAEYKCGFGMDILDPAEDGLSNEERAERTYRIFKREAIFHIRFERIHPFNDGNGRTGRIILNQQLLKQRFAPVMITGYMSSQYKQLINNNDVEGFTQMLLSSSSQQMVNWVSINKPGFTLKKSEVSPDNSILAELEGYQDDEKPLQKVKRSLKGKPDLF